MSVAITSKEDKADTVDLLRRLILRFIFPGLTDMATREAILAHFNYLRARPGLFVDTKLEIIPELQATKITFLVSHTPQGPVKHHA